MESKNKIYAYYTELPAWAKGLVIVGGVGLLAFAGIKIARAVFPSEKRRKEREINRNIQEEIKEAEQQGQKATFPDSSYDLYANSIHNAIQFCVGDDYDTVVKISKRMMNNLDVAKLIKAYGTRQRYCFGLPAGGKDDLFTSLQAELGQEWGGITNYRIKQINENWKSKGITYQI
jgi:hypothetical protein